MVVVYSFFLSVCLTNTLSAPSSVRELEIFFCGACFPLEAQFQAQGFPLPLEESFAKVMERLCCAAVSLCCSWTAQPGALHASPWHSVPRHVQKAPGHSMSSMLSQFFI